MEDKVAEERESKMLSAGPGSYLLLLALADSSDSNLGNFAGKLIASHCCQFPRTGPPGAFSAATFWSYTISEDKVTFGLKSS